MKNNSCSTIANLDFLAAIKNGGPHAYGLFYNSLMLSDNLNAANILRPGIDDNDIMEIDGAKLYVIPQ
jgi:hypothetical protein